MSFSKSLRRTESASTISNPRKVAFAAILKSFRRKKEYHKLKSGETIKLDLQSWQELSDFAENQNILPEELAGGEVILPMQQLFSLAAEKLTGDFDGDLFDAWLLGRHVGGAF